MVEHNGHQNDPYLGVTLSGGTLMDLIQKLFLKLNFAASKITYRLPC